MLKHEIKRGFWERIQWLLLISRNRARKGLQIQTRSIKSQSLYHEADAMCICISDIMTAKLIFKQKIKNYLRDYGKWIGSMAVAFRKLLAATLRSSIASEFDGGNYMLIITPQVKFWCCIINRYTSNSKIWLGPFPERWIVWLRHLTTDYSDGM